MAYRLAAVGKSLERRVDRMDVLSSSVANATRDAMRARHNGLSLDWMGRMTLVNSVE